VDGCFGTKGTMCGLGDIKRVQASAHTYTDGCAHTHVYTYLRARAHTHTHTHTHTSFIKEVIFGALGQDSLEKPMGLFLL
jgi:hypothetical protein